MKKTIKFLGIIAMMIFFISCEKDDNGSGRIRYDGYYTYGGEYFLRFFEDGTVTTSYNAPPSNQNTAKGTYSIDNNIISFKIPDLFFEFILKEVVIVDFSGIVNKNKLILNSDDSILRHQNEEWHFDQRIY